MVRRKPSKRLSITIPGAVHARILAAAARNGMSVSDWMTDSARFHLLRADGLAAVAAWEDEHGRFTEEEMEQARRRVDAQLGSPSKGRRKSA